MRSKETEAGANNLSAALKRENNKENGGVRGCQAGERKCVCHAHLTSLI